MKKEIHYAAMTVVARKSLMVRSSCKNHNHKFIDRDLVSINSFLEAGFSKDIEEVTCLDCKEKLGITINN